MTENRLALVYAPGYNEINIPVTAFASFEEGYEQLVKMFGYRPSIDSDPDDKKRHAEFIPLKGKAELFNASRDKKLIKQLFRSYYSGCGDAYTIVLREIENGEMPLFAFDLD